MASNIGTISVSVKARTDKFRKGMRQSQSSIKAFGRAVATTTATVATFGLALGAAAAGGLAFWVKRQAEAIDSTAKFADRIGITTEALGGLQHAAALTGVTTRNLQLGLQRMTRRISEAAQGTGEAKKAIAELGLSAAALNRLAPDEQFKALAQAMAGVQNQADRVRLAMRLFDSEGVSLVNTLRLGRAGLEEVEERAKRLGIAFSRIEAAKVEEANDAILELKQALTGVANSITIALAIPIRNLAQKLTETIANPGFKTKVVEFFRDMTIGIVKASGEIQKLVEQIKAFEGVDFKATKRFRVGPGGFPVMVPGLQAVPRFGDTNPAAIDVSTAKIASRIAAEFEQILTPQVSRAQAKGALDALFGMAGLPGPVTVSRPRIAPTTAAPSGVTGPMLGPAFNPPTAADLSGLFNPFAPQGGAEASARPFSRVEFGLRSAIESALSGDYSGVLEGFANQLRDAASAGLARALIETLQENAGGFSAFLSQALGGGQTSAV